MRYAGILDGQVIAIKESDFVPVFPKTNDGEEIVVLACDEFVQIGDEYVNDEIISTGIAKVKEPTQLDRIEEAINKNQKDIIDEYTLSLIEEGVI